MGAAQTVIDKEGDLLWFYKEQLEKGLDHRAGKKNLARKIAAIALSVMRKGVHYKKDYEVKKETAQTKPV